MPDILSQSQIDELLNGLKTGAIDATTINEDEGKRPLKEYDFRSPKKFTKEQLKTLNSIHESYARMLSSYFTGVLRMYSQVSVTQIEEQRYHEFNNALPDSVMIGVVDLKPNIENVVDSQIMIEISKDISFAIIDRLLGGSGEIVKDKSDMRDFTEIEVALMESILIQIIRLLKDTWIAHVELDPMLISVETNSRLVQSIGLDEIVVIIVMDVNIKGQKGAISICIPAVYLEEIMATLNSKNPKSNRKFDEIKEAQKKETIFSSLREGSLEITGALGEMELALNDIMTLQVDDILRLDKSIDADITLFVEKSPWFTGKLGIKKNKKAVRINKILQKEVNI